jgi:SAM-dependent methyltransferase
LVIDPGSDADIVAMAERLPVADGSADLVLCTQVLEHVEDPSRAVSEMARVLKPGGICLLTTHGTWFYHPDPEDYWRWTPAGLRRVFEAAGFGEVKLEPVGGTKLALAVLGLTSFERSMGDGTTGALARRLLVAPANLLGSKILLRRITGRSPLAGELAINYLVTARRLGSPP